jgi:hypothetical protein
MSPIARDYPQTEGRELFACRIDTLCVAWNFSMRRLNCILAASLLTIATALPLIAEVPNQARTVIDRTIGSPGTYIPEEGVYKRLFCRDQNNNMSIGVPKVEERRDLTAYFKEQKGELNREEVRMSDWLSDVIGNDLIAVYEGLYFTEDALIWLREKPRTFGELRAKEIDWLRWMAANVHDKDILEKLSRDAQRSCSRMIARTAPKNGAME